MHKWADKQKDQRFKSVFSCDSTGVVQVLLHLACNTLRSNGSNKCYYMALTCHSKSIRIEFWNIEPKDRSCDSLFRVSLIKEVSDLISTFCDSVRYNYTPYKGDIQVQSIRKPNGRAFSDSALDKIFSGIKTDSLSRYDSIKADSVNKVVVSPTPEYKEVELEK